MGATGLAANPKEYRERLDEQTDDADRRLGVRAHARHRDPARRPPGHQGLPPCRSIDERSFERVFAAGGGPPAVIGRDREGRLLVPAITLHALVPGSAPRRKDGRARLIEYLVENFEDLVYV